MKFKWYLNGGGGFNPHCSKVLHLLFLYKVNNLIIRIQKGLKTSNLDFVFWKYCGKIERGKIDNFEKNDANIYILFKKKKKDTLHAFIFGHDSIPEFAEYTKDYLNISLFIILQ